MVLQVIVKRSGGVVQTPERHTLPVPQVTEQPPQLIGSVAVLRQVVPQSVWPVGQGLVTHAPA